MKTIEMLLHVESLHDRVPDMESQQPVGRRDQGRGTSVYLNLEEAIRFVGLIEFLPGLGLRGKHYHQQKREHFYLIDGLMTGYFWLPDEPDQIHEIELRKGDLLTVEPGLVHAFQAIERTLVVELSPDTFDCQDVYYPEQVDASLAKI